MGILKKKNDPLVMTVNSSEANNDDLSFIKSEAFKALSEMARIYSSVRETSIKGKINEIMRITDKIAQDAYDALASEREDGKDLVVIA